MNHLYRQNPHPSIEASQHPQGNKWSASACRIPFPYPDNGPSGDRSHFFYSQNANQNSAKHQYQIYGCTSSRKRSLPNPDQCLYGQDTKRLKSQSEVGQIEVLEPDQSLNWVGASCEEALPFLGHHYFETDTNPILGSTVDSNTVSQHTQKLTSQSYQQEHNEDEMQQQAADKNCLASRLVAAEQALHQLSSSSQPALYSLDSKAVKERLPTGQALRKVYDIAAEGTVALVGQEPASGENVTDSFLLFPLNHILWIPYL